MLSFLTHFDRFVFDRLRFIFTPKMPEDIEDQKEFEHYPSLLPLKFHSN